MESANEVKAANPQAEDGHTDLANEIVEALYLLQLSGNQWRILWVILRQTYGWHKKCDRISISFFQRKTEIKRRHVSRATKNIFERNIITKNDTTYITTYGFQKDYTKWILSPKKTHITKNDTKTITKIGAHKRNSKEKDYPPRPPDVLSCAAEIVANTYHTILPELPRISKWSPERLKRLAAFQKKDPRRGTAEWWEAYFNLVRTSSFLLGKGPRGWRANIDWLLNESNFLKVKEGHLMDRAET